MSEQPCFPPAPLGEIVSFLLGNRIAWEEGAAGPGTAAPGGGPHLNPAHAPAPAHSRPWQS